MKQVGNKKERRYEAKIAFSIKEELRVALRMKCLKNGTTVKEVMTVFVEEFTKE